MKNLLLFLFSLFALQTSINAQEIELTNAQLSRAMDSIIVNNMEQYHVPGVSYAIVKGKQVVNVGSRGFANINARQKVMPDTRFMLGSIAKLFTVIAVLQLYEEGSVQLDEDINKYLKSFQLPYKVTLRQLLTHTGGLEESVFDRVRLSPKNFLPLDIYLKGHIPDQILTPGVYPAYSNHGMALVGLVVQEVSGQPFEVFVQDRILTPLEMFNSSFNLDDRSVEMMATPYTLNDDKSIPAELQYVMTTPSAMLISTASDMAKFMIFLLNHPERNILKPETQRLMQATQFTAHPKLWGRGFGFFERNYRGNHLLEHGGARKGFYGLLSLAPKDSIGVIVIFNGGSSDFRNKVTYDFLGSIYPERLREKNFAKDKIEVSEYEGTYLSNRRTASDFGKLILQITFVQKIKIEAIDANTLSLLGSTFQAETRDQFEISDDSTASFPIAFGRTSDGNVNVLFLSGGSDSFQKMKWFENEQIGIVTFVLATILFLTLSIVGIGKLIRKKVLFQILNIDHAVFTNRLLCCLLNFFFISLLISVLIVTGEGLEYKIPNILFPIFTLPILGFIPLFIMCYHLVKVWHTYSTKIKIYNTLFVAFSICYSWQLYFWNFIGYNF
jgi:CubicO group peptidase (beta-lactamase class C family)